MELLKYLKSKAFLRTIITMFVLLIIFVFFISKVLAIITHHDEKIAVPDLNKLNLDSVQVVLKKANLNFKIIDSTQYNPNFPPKSVIEQIPEAGDFVKKDRKIYLTLNPSNYRKVSIPQIFGKTMRQATVHLKSLGFRIGTSPQYIPDKGKDVVRGLIFNNKKVTEGELLRKNSKVEFVLGDGSLN